MSNLFKGNIAIGGHITPTSPQDTFFVTTEEFERMIKDGELYEYSEHHGHYYGTSKKLLNEKISKGKIIVKDIEVNGTENLLKILGNDTRIVTIFLKVEKEELKKETYIIFKMIAISTFSPLLYHYSFLHIVL